MKIVLITVILLGLCFALMAVKVIFVKGGRFPSSHVGANPRLRERGISCASHGGAAAPKKDNNQL